MCVWMWDFFTRIDHRHQPMRKALNFKRYSGWKSNYPITITSRWWKKEEERKQENGTPNIWITCQKYFCWNAIFAFVFFLHFGLKFRLPTCFIVAQRLVFCVLFCCSIFVYFLWSIMTHDDGNTFQVWFIFFDRKYYKDAKSNVQFNQPTVHCIICV